MNNYNKYYIEFDYNMPIIPLKIPIKIENTFMKIDNNITLALFILF